MSYRQNQGTGAKRRVDKDTERKQHQGIILELE
jgi:hypothetical protein